MNDRQVLAFAVFALLIVMLLNEIAFSLANAKIIVAIPRASDSVIEGEAREVRDTPVSD